MGIIQKLDQDVARKIAAGEIVERPVSVIKELVENSLDAGATDIRVELLDGGKGLIRITDNGGGMARDDALLCFESHATSKIAGIDDLERIGTLGFRGEALSSIAAVARVTLMTSDGQAEQGTRILIEGKEQGEAADIAFPRGTSIEVKDLFFNLPARKKFLRSDRAELNRITRLLTDIALAYPVVRFALQHGERRVFDYPVVTGLKERLYQVFGKAFIEGLLSFDYTEGGRRLHGFASRPPSARLDRKHQFIFINGRLVKDPTVQAALNQAYKNFLEKGQSAEAVVVLEIPVSEVDVNVHPAKSEVRFQDSRSIFSFVYRCVEQALLRELGIKEVYPEKSEGPAAFHVQEMSQADLIGRPGRKRKPSLPAASQALRDEAPAESPVPRVLGQYLDFYIVAEDEDGILIIDQHNAHERVLFDRYLEIDKKQKWPRKMILHPKIVELSPAQALNLEENRELLENSGFRVDEMGRRSFALKEFPDIFDEQEAVNVLLALLEDVGQEQVESKRKRMLATLACKSAVKAGESLAFEKMDYLVEELFKTSNTALCPHGRPITLRLRRYEIEKALRRK
ncbi:MAG: DNA mismatch repair endonuclease MutL [Candidatus Aminicenantaceae bacterium]